MAEEFQESDIIFSDNHRRRYPNQEHNSFDITETILSPEKYSSRAVRNLKNKNQNKKVQMANSLPLKIPESFFQCGAEDYQDEEWEGQEMVPPHVIVDRRIAGKIAFSVCTGNGRTLKGRDLSQVRNSILRLTGFLET